MQPINYLTQVADPFAQSLQGFQLGAGIVETQQKQVLAEQQRQQKQAIFEQQQQQQQLAAQEQARFFAKSNPTMRDALQFAAVLPKDRADALRPYIENFSKAQQQSVLKTNGQILSALQVNPETGIKLLKDFATAQRNSGDEEEALLYERIAEAAADPARGPSMAFKSLVTVTSRIPGAKEMFESIDKASSTARTEELAPATLKKAVADADKAIADANIRISEAANVDDRLKAEQDLRLAQIEKEQALTAASVGGEGRAAGLAESVLGKSVADAAAAVADAEKKVAEAKDTPARLEAEQGLRVAQAEQQRALTAASVGGEARAVAKAPGELIEANAKADKAVADAKVAQATATNAPEKAAADAKRATADAEKARIEAQYEEQKIKLGFRKTEQDIIIAKENARIAALNAAQAKETNVLRRAELKQKIDDATEKRDAADRDQKATVANQSADIDNFLNTAQRILQTPKDVIASATGPVASRLPTLSSDVADFEALVEALGSQAFIAQIPKIKGTGSLSEKEGDKLQASLQTLSLKQSPARLEENVKEAVRLLKKVRENISIKYGVPALPLDVPAGELSVTVSGTTYNFPTKAAADTFKSSDAYKRAAGIR